MGVFNTRDTVPERMGVFGDTPNSASENSKVKLTLKKLRLVARGYGFCRVWKMRKHELENGLDTFYRTGVIPLAMVCKKKLGETCNQSSQCITNTCVNNTCISKTKNPT